MGLRFQLYASSMRFLELNHYPRQELLSGLDPPHKNGFWIVHPSIINT